MCLNCAMQCEGSSLYDLYLSSKNCKHQKHAVQKRTNRLKGYGNLYAAVECNNASIQLQVNDLLEAKYYANLAIKCSYRYKDNLNLNIRKLAMNLLKEINNSKIKISSPLFTLSELILFSNTDESSTPHYCKYYENDSEINLPKKICTERSNPYETREVMVKNDIENIDNIVQSLKYKMCSKCAMHCAGNSLYDLYVSSNYCKTQKHAVHKRTPLLKGYGNLCAAVEYINATLKNKVNDLFPWPASS